MFFKLSIISTILMQLSYTHAYNDDAFLDLGSTQPDTNAKKLQLWLTISAEKRFLEVSWKNAPANSDDNILITKQKPKNFQKIKLNTENVLRMSMDTIEGSGGDSTAIYWNKPTESNNNYKQRDRIEYGNENIFDKSEIDGDNEFGNEEFLSAKIRSTTTVKPRLLPQHYWISNNGFDDMIAGIQPSASSLWYTTGVHFDHNLSTNITKHTKCYGYFANYINVNGDILAATCLRAYPTWMNDLRSVIGGLRLRDLFIPGTHDSGSYRVNFDPLLRETIVTKYALTQDDDIRGQLMHGARYLDIRVGYYRNTDEKFFINHGITRQRPLLEIIQQVKDFVLETNEIVIFGLKEFPVGFGKGSGVHNLLAHFLREHFDNLVVHPSLRWSASLNDIWSRRQNVILAYDKPSIEFAFANLLFPAVDQRWGNVREWHNLERHLKSANTFDVSKLSSRPVADMAELTPDVWGVIFDQYGGLRRMADQVNYRVSQLYRDDLGTTANIVAVDFIRGTTLMEIAIDYNKRKVIP